MSPTGLTSAISWASSWEAKSSCRRKQPKCKGSGPGPAPCTCRRPCTFPSPSRYFSSHGAVYLAQLSRLSCTSWYSARVSSDWLRLPKAEAYICREIICSKALRWLVWVLGAYPPTPELSWSCLFRDFLVEKLPSWLFMLEFTEIHEHVGAFVICGHSSLTGVGGCALRSLGAVKRSCSLGPLENTCIS